MRRHVQLPYTVETWLPDDRRQRAAVRDQRSEGSGESCLVLFAYCLLGLVAGAGIAWLLMTLHRGGWTP